MGSNQIVVVAVLLLAAATPLAYGQLPGLSPTLASLINAANITGRICCTPTVNCANGSVGLPGVTVDLNCTTLTGSVVKLSEGITGLDGTFALLVNDLDSMLGFQLGGITGLVRCRILASLPLDFPVCPDLTTLSGTYFSAFSYTDLASNRLLGLVANFVAELFSMVTVTT